MLYGYPITAAKDNWLHDNLHIILKSVHDRLDAGMSLPKWPGIVPDIHQTQLRSHHGLKRKITNYYNIAASLSKYERDKILTVFSDQNGIKNLLSCTQNCASIGSLPEIIRQPVEDLFYFAFELLTSLDIRDRHYQLIYDDMPDHMCPFCGCEYFKKPGEPREAYDHYLLKDKYPFAAANLYNVVPMGHDCNTHFKHDTDILIAADGSRRRSSYPYNPTIVTVSLDRSVPFTGSDGQIPEWEIDLLPNTEEITTWEAVFHIRERYKNVLDVSYKRWLRAYGNWCRSHKHEPSTAEEVAQSIWSYYLYCNSLGIEDREFLKAAVFHMLYMHINMGNLKLIRFLKGIRDAIPKYPSPHK